MNIQYNLAGDTSYHMKDISALQLFAFSFDTPLSTSELRLSYSHSSATSPLPVQPVNPQVDR